MVRVTGLEPARSLPQEPKSCASASSAIPAFLYSTAKCCENQSIQLFKLNY